MVLFSFLIFRIHFSVSKIAPNLSQCRSFVHFLIVRNSFLSKLNLTFLKITKKTLHQITIHWFRICWFSSDLGKNNEKNTTHDSLSGSVQNGILIVTKKYESFNTFDRHINCIGFIYFYRISNVQNIKLTNLFINARQNVPNQNNINRNYINRQEHRHES